MQQHRTPRTARPEPEPEPDLEDDLDRLPLTVRARNILKADGINTISHLCQQTPVNLLRIPNLGKYILREIERELARIGRHLGDTP